MFLLVKQTLMRGRSLVPLIFWRMRQRRRRASFCFCSVLISVRHGFGLKPLKSQAPVSHVSRLTPHTLLHSLAFLADHAFIGVADALALVGFGRVEATQFGGDLAHSLAVGPFDGEVAARHRGLEADALNFELLDETLADAAHHVVDQRAAEPMERLGARVIALSGDNDLAVLDLEVGSARKLPVELAFRAFDENLLAFDLHLYFRRDGYRLLSNS